MHRVAFVYDAFQLEAAGQFGARGGALAADRAVLRARRLQVDFKPRSPRCNTK
jgi:hypothetical protein